MYIHLFSRTVFHFSKMRIFRYLMFCCAPTAQNKMRDLEIKLVNMVKQITREYKIFVRIVIYTLRLSRVVFSFYQSFACSPLANKIQLLKSIAYTIFGELQEELGVSKSRSAAYYNNTSIWLYQRAV